MQCIIIYHPTNTEAPQGAVLHLTNIMFAHGFRTFQIEQQHTSTQIQRDTKTIEEWIAEQDDSGPYCHQTTNLQPNLGWKKQRRLDQEYLDR